jgi:hypothetical protein
MTCEADLLAEKFAKGEKALKQFDKVSKGDPAAIAARIRVNQDELAASSTLSCAEPEPPAPLSLGDSRRTQC